jgi:hypothetical protein
MKRLFVFSLLLSAFCFLPYTLVAQKQKKIDSQTKVFTKNFTVNVADQLDVNTCYTDVVFREWEKNEIEFITTITLKKATESDMERILNDIKVTNKQLGKKVSYNLTYSNSGAKKLNIINNDMEINLLIKIPKNIFLNITSSFGDFNLDNVLNNFTADINFGELIVENLYGNKNTIVLKHGKLTINQAKQLTLNMNFSTGNMQEIGTLKLKSSFSTIKMDQASRMDISSSHDNFSIKDVDKIEGIIDFGTLNIYSLKNSFVFTKFSFSKVTITKVLSSFTTINIASSHSTITLKIPPDQSFAFDYSGSFTKFKDENMKLNDATFKSGMNSVEMRGFYGKNPDSGKKIKIEASFGTVSLFGQ